MTTRRKMLAAAASALALPLLAAADCKKEDQPANPRPGSEAKPTNAAPTRGEDNGPEPYTEKGGWDRGYIAALSAWVESSAGAYTVTANATDMDTGENINLIDTPTETGMKMNAGEQFKHVMAYPKGHRVELVITVQSERPSSKGYIAVRPEGRRAGKRTEVSNGAAKWALRTIVE